MTPVKDADCGDCHYIQSANNLHIFCDNRGCGRIKSIWDEKNEKYITLYDTCPISKDHCSFIVDSSKKGKGRTLVCRSCGRIKATRKDADSAWEVLY